MSSDYTILGAKSGMVTTDATLGTAQVVFTNGFDNDGSEAYAVFLTCLDGGAAVVAYPSNITNTGFTISSYLLNQPGGAGVKPCTLTVQASVTVYWLAVIKSNV